MAERTCFNCMYCICDPCMWLRLLWVGEPILPRCANHPRWPGQLHDVPGVPCRHYRPKPVLPEGEGVRLIALTDGSYAYVDAADYEWLNQWKWRLDDGYPTRMDKGKKITMHRQIMQPPPGKVVDHFDGNRAHNCRANLRICTHLENSGNRRKCSDSSSIYKGVFFHKQKRKWYAQCNYADHPVWRGYFDTEVEAARAYDQAAVECFGEFARLNFPRDWPPERQAQVHAEWQEQQKQRRRKKPKVKRKKARSKTKKVKSRSMKSRRTPRSQKERAERS